jgi:oligopeptide/dipeptide ABC transporter ATP-binding protein
LLQVRDLKTYFFTSNGIVKAVDGISFSLKKGETMALVGESGCGKSVTALSLLRLVPEPGKIVGGQIRFDGEDLLHLTEPEMRRVRGNRIAMVFQEPMTALNPVLRIGNQISEVLLQHQDISKADARTASIDLLHQVGIPAPEQRIREFPHQLSGGLRQRVIIAMALACDPQLLIADEPTTALDVTIQAQIMDLLSNLQSKRQMATLLITHDLGVVAESAQQVAIMYAGIIVEYASVNQLFDKPGHPYTRGLLASVPRLGDKRDRLSPIDGHVPSPLTYHAGCPFLERCPEVIPICSNRCPKLKEIAPGHYVRCWRAE